MTKIHDLLQHGQSIWIDYIRRQYIQDGGMQQAIDDGVRGVTSNPAIFEKAIAGSDDYDEDIQKMVAEGKSTDEIYETLAIADIQAAADLFRTVYDSSDGVDGYVSLEVSPTLARDTNGTIEEARRLFAAVDRPNVMIKVPATPAGIPAIETLIGEGINVNVTLMFSMKHYEDVANAYITGLEKFKAANGDLSKVASVASFFVSRVDSRLDPMLEEKGAPELMGKVAIANSKVVYQRFQEIFNSERWNALAEEGARVQRPLWASTSTKNPEYPDTLYVDSLIGEHTVDTTPPDTLEAFLDHGTVAATVADDLDEAIATLEKLADLGIDLSVETEALQDEGVVKFEKPFASMMDSLEAKRQQFAGEAQ